MPRFVRRTEAERLQAARRSRDEPVEAIPPEYLPCPPGAFEPTRLPRRGDWLRDQEERGQSFVSFSRRQMVARPHSKYDTLELVPVGPFGPDAPSLERLARLAAAFFGCRCVVAPTLSLKEAEACGTADTPGSRIGDEQQLQLRCSAIFSAVASRPKGRRGQKHGALHLPFATVAVTMADLYPHEDYSFVYGQALPCDCVGVFSFARFGNDEGFVLMHPAAPPPVTKPAAKTKSPSRYQESVLYRSAKVLCHEVGHLFGINHCVFYQCLMCGSNHLVEFDRKPFMLCPIDLRKLQHAVGFDVKERYRALQQLANEFGWEADAKWYQLRLDTLQLAPCAATRKLRTSQPEGASSTSTAPPQPRRRSPAAHTRVPAARVGAVSRASDSKQPARPSGRPTLQPSTVNMTI